MERVLQWTPLDYALHVSTETQYASWNLRLYKRCDGSVVGRHGCFESWPCLLWLPRGAEAICVHCWRSAVISTDVALQQSPEVQTSCNIPDIHLDPRTYELPGTECAADVGKK
eukprot:SAG11_NODE_9189_length_934_cov_1.438323_2_plen_113_part_00